MSLPRLDAAALAALPADGQVTLIEFSAAWCGPCKALAPVLAELATSYAGQLRVVEVDVGDDPALGERFAVRAMPTMVLWRGGREVGRVVGARPRRFLAGTIDRALAGDEAIAGP